MSLPPVPLPRDTVDVEGVPVQVRGMSRAEVSKLAGYGSDLDAAENWVLACGCDISMEDAAAWRGAVPADAAGPVIDRICVLSGISEGAQKSS